MDRSLLIHWYDLPAESRTGYLQWLHGSFMQKLSKRPGVLWAAHYEVRKYEIPSRVRPTRDPAVPRGNDYVLMLGAESSHAFAKPLDFFLKRDTACVEPDLSAEDRAMLALREEVRTSIMTEEARVSGPEIAMRPDGGAHVERFEFVHDTVMRPAGHRHHLAQGHAPGQLRQRRHAPARIPAEQLLFRRLIVAAKAAELDARRRRAAAMKEMAGLYPEMIEWTERCVPLVTHAHGSPHIGVRLWPPVK